MSQIRSFERSVCAHVAGMQGAQLGNAGAVLDGVGGDTTPVPGDIASTANVLFRSAERLAALIAADAERLKAVPALLAHADR